VTTVTRRGGGEEVRSKYMKAAALRTTATYPEGTLDKQGFWFRALLEVGFSHAPIGPGQEEARERHRLSDWGYIGFREHPFSAVRA